MPIVLSSACADWFDAHHMDQVEYTYRGYINIPGREIHEAKKNSALVRPAYTKKTWLVGMLSKPFEYKKDGLKCLKSAYEAALYVIGCVRECPINSIATKYVNGSFIIGMYRALNSELAASILSGFCILSVASRQVAQYHHDREASKADAYFLVIDCNDNAPSSTYAWAIKLADYSKVSTFALRNTKRSDDTFEWVACESACSSNPSELAKQLLIDSRGATKHEYGSPKRRRDTSIDLSQVFYSDQRYKRMLLEKTRTSSVHGTDSSVGYDRVEVTRYGDLYLVKGGTDQQPAPSEQDSDGEHAAASDLAKSENEHKTVGKSGKQDGKTKPADGQGKGKGHKGVAGAKTGTTPPIPASEKVTQTKVKGGSAAAPSNNDAARKPAGSDRGGKKGTNALLVVQRVLENWIYDT
jgi:hypothetical protein